jgi:uncharacterized membrane protein
MQPPTFYKLVTAFENDPGSKHLRFGQWFFNRYLSSVEGKDIDIMYNTRDKSVALEIIKKYYVAYQWDLT